MGQQRPSKFATVPSTLKSQTIPTLALSLPTSRAVPGSTPGDALAGQTLGSGGHQHARQLVDDDLALRTCTPPPSARFADVVLS